MSEPKSTAQPYQRIRARGEDIRRFILDSVSKHPSDISSVAAKHFGVTRQAIHKHLQRLVANGLLSESGETRDHVYNLAPLVDWNKSYEIVAGMAEDVVWSDDIKPLIADLPANVLDIWHHAFTEMFNNAIDHSGGNKIEVELVRTAISTRAIVHDDGIGIFRKIQKALGLIDERHAILELSKGKLTTDPDNHSGEGIFFTSRMFNSFRILSGGAFFSHEDGESEDWLLESEKYMEGTAVSMELANNASRTTREVFDSFVSGDEYDFSKTVVPVKLALYGNDRLISRSQAKRVLARVELFKVVVFDFSEVDSIGQAFADEIFRVFARQHPEIELTPVHIKPAVRRMIDRARHRDGAPEEK